METADRRRVAVIGAGPAGLSQLQALVSWSDQVEIVCYEKQSDWGGQWNYTWRTGLDEYGEPVHSSMYQHLVTNAPKECYEFADYTFDQHFGKAVPSFLPKDDYRGYFIGRADKSNIRHFIKFCTVVKNVDYEGEKFIVCVMDLISGKSRKEQFDYVIVAIGHFSIPHVPHFDGIDTFPGRVIHSHDFRIARQFANENILVIGANYSAEDIAMQIKAFGALSVTITYRSKPPTGLNWPGGIDFVPLLSRIQGKTVHFSDGSQRVFDSIIMCTGYKHHFPFITDDLRLDTKNCFYPAHLYKGLFWQTNPRLIYLGMQNIAFSLTLFDVQARYVRDVILNHIVLPDDPEDRVKDITEWMEREKSLMVNTKCVDDTLFQELLIFQSEYLDDLQSAIKEYPVINLDAVLTIFKQFIRHRKENMSTYRQHQFASTITGTMSTLTNN